MQWELTPYSIYISRGIYPIYKTTRYHLPSTNLSVHQKNELLHTCTCSNAKGTALFFHNPFINMRQTYYSTKHLTYIPGRKFAVLSQTLGYLFSRRVWKIHNDHSGSISHKSLHSGLPKTRGTTGYKSNKTLETRK